MSPQSVSCELAVRVTPRASRQKIDVAGDIVRIWVMASPTDGQANDALCELLAKTLKVSKSSVAIVSGHTSRQKRIRIDGLDLQETMNRLGGGSLF